VVKLCNICKHKPKRGIAEKLINFTEDEEQQYEEQSDPEETFVKPKNPPRRRSIMFVVVIFLFHRSILLGFLLHQIQIEMLICHQTLG
jgi:hypothetical protein